METHLFKKFCATVFGRSHFECSDRSFGNGENAASTNNPVASRVAANKQDVELTLVSFAANGVLGKHFSAEMRTKVLTTNLSQLSLVEYYFLIPSIAQYLFDF
jgi:hypothetical protein